MLKVDFLCKTAVAEWTLRLRGAGGGGGAATFQSSFFCIEDLTVLEILVGSTEASDVTGLFLGDSHRGNDASTLHFIFSSCLCSKGNAGSAINASLLALQLGQQFQYPQKQIHQIQIDHNSCEHVVIVSQAVFAAFQYNRSVDYDIDAE